MNNNSLTIKYSHKGALMDAEVVETRFKLYVAYKLKCPVAKIPSMDKEVAMVCLVDVIGVEIRVAAALMHIALSTSYRILQSGRVQFQRLSQKSPFIVKCLQFLDYMYDTVHNRGISVNFTPGRR